MEFIKTNIKLTREKYIKQIEAVQHINRDLQHVAKDLELPDVTVLYIVALATTTSCLAFESEQKDKRLDKVTEYALYVSEMLINMMKKQLTILELMEDWENNK